MRTLYLLILCILAAACAIPNSQLTDTIHYYQMITKKPYDDVLAELKIAITEQNFRITSHSRVGKVIRQRDNISFPNYDTIQFCNLTHAKTLLELSSDTLRHMPCSVVVYTENDRVIVKTRLLPINKANPKINAFSEKINGILKDIVDFAVEI